MHRNTAWAAGVLLVGSTLGAGINETDVQGAKTAEQPATKAGAQEAKGPRLKPWQPVDASFNGCSEGFCGTRGQNSKAVLQPGAKVADYTYCLVSGAFFKITEKHFHADVNGKTVYFCCEGCARYFAANRERVLRARGLL